MNSHPCLQRGDKVRMVTSSPRCDKNNIVVVPFFEYNIGDTYYFCRYDIYPDTDNNILITDTRDHAMKDEYQIFCPISHVKKIGNINSWKQINIIDPFPDNTDSEYNDVSA